MNRLYRVLTYAKPTPLEQASTELEQARRDLLSHSAWREHYAALEDMLKKRILRLETAVQSLSTPKEPS